LAAIANRYETVGEGCEQSFRQVVKTDALGELPLVGSAESAISPMFNSSMLRATKAMSTLVGLHELSISIYGSLPSPRMRFRRAA